jgi:formate C-acetyltransferase
MPEFSWESARDLPLSPRIEGLSGRFFARYATLGRRKFWEDDEVAARNAALLAAYRDTAGLPPIRRRARALAACAAGLPVRITAVDLLVGSQACNRALWEQPECHAELAALGYAATTGHIVHDYEGLLRQGVAGYRAALSQACPADEAARETLGAFSEALEAFAHYVTRHADAAAALADTHTGVVAAEWQQRAADLRHLTGAPPHTFAQALQLLWLAHIFLHLENPSVAISFGRFDQYLWPFLRTDLAEGRHTPASAFELVCAFLLKCCEGEESQNLVLGGMDRHGRDASNPLALLVLAAMRRLGTFQPSLIVRVHPDTPPAFLSAACEAVGAGNGNPGFLNDPVVIAGLEAAGIPTEAARDYGVVGCYEATVPGACYPNTVLCALHLVRDLTEYLHAPQTADAPTFADFLAGWYAHVEATYLREALPRAADAWRWFRDSAPSPFGSLLMQGCLARALPLEAGGTRYNLLGVNLLGLGTVVDSLHAIRELVFTQGTLTLAELSAALAADFPDEALRRRLLDLADRYGTDAPATNALARDVSARLSAMVLASTVEEIVQPYPGFFLFAADIYQRGMASPDGRRADDPISYGVAPAATVPTAPTSLLRAAAHVAQHAAACGCPLALTLSPREVAGADGAHLIADLVTTYFHLGGFHLHINVVTPDDLRAAQRAPAQHAQLTVRVSGYSARFVQVDPCWQDVLIARAEQGR